MSDAGLTTGRTAAQTRPVRASAGTSRQRWLWVALVVFAMALPWLFYGWQTHRHSGFLLTMLSQMGMMIIFSLSYNMLMGQSGLGFGVVFGYMATRQRGTAFAMITLGMGELVATAAIMFHHFFGGEGGVSTNRMIENSLFGLSYASSVQVYYLILAWTVIAALGMLFLTRTPLGAMANATRDNFERAQFMGYDPRRVRFLQFALSGLFAGIGGGLYAITYEIVTFDAVSSALSANVVLMTYIGGATIFYGPILGATLITLLQSGLSMLSNAWLIYVGVLFIGMVTFAPAGFAGMIEAHGPIARAGRLSRLAVPYLRMSIPGLAVLLGFIGIVELTSFRTIGEAQGKHLVLFGSDIDVRSLVPWLVAVALLAAGGLWLRVEARAFARVWDNLTADLKTRGL